MRVILHHSQQTAQAAGELILGRDARGLIRRGDRAGPGLDDLGERVALELHITLDRFDQVGNQVMAAFELDVDLAPGIIDLVA